MILNNGFNRSDSPQYLSSPFYPLDYLSPGAIFRAARCHGVRTYIVNKQPHFEFAHVLHPPLRQVDLTEPYKSRTAFIRKVKSEGFSSASRCELLNLTYQTISIRANCLRAPASADSNELESRSSALLERLAQLRPDRTYFAEQVYRPSFMKTSSLLVLGRYQLGSVSLLRGLDTVSPRVACRDACRTASHAGIDIDFFAALKLLPFAVKLDKLVQGLSGAGEGADSGTGSGTGGLLWQKVSCGQYLSIGAKLFCDTILSDMADEIFMVVKHKVRHHCIPDCTVINTVIASINMLSYSYLCLPKPG